MNLVHFGRVPSSNMQIKSPKASVTISFSYWQRDACKHPRSRQRLPCILVRHLSSTCSVFVLCGTEQIADKYRTAIGCAPKEYRRCKETKIMDSPTSKKLSRLNQSSEQIQTSRLVNCRNSPSRLHNFRPYSCHQ